MKKVKQFLRSGVLTVGLCMIAAGFSSCSDDDDNGIYPSSSAFVSMVNALPGSQPVDFFLDENEINYYGIPYGSGVDYVNAYTGNRTMKVYDSQSKNQIITADTTFEENEYYSVFLTGSLQQPDLLILHDQVARPGSGKAGVRLVNLSSDASAVDLVIKKGSIIASDVNYKGVSQFMAVDPFNTYTLEIRKAGTALVLASKEYKFIDDALYTVSLQGHQATETGNLLNLEVQMNVHYIN